MSDEQPPPPALRLKPRINLPPVSTPPTAPAAPTDAASVSNPVPAPAPAALPPDMTPAPQPSAAEPMKFRLKPKTPPPEGLPAETPVPFSTPPIPVEPALPPKPAAAPAPVALAPDMANPTLAPTPPPAPAAEVKPAPPPLAPPAPKFIPTPKAVTELPPLSPSLSAPLPTSAPPEAPIKADKWLAAVVVLILVIAAATWGVQRLFKAHQETKATAKTETVTADKKTAPAPAVPATAPAAAPAKPVPGGQTKLVDNPQSAAGKAIARARDTVAAVEQQERTTGTTAILDEAASPAPVPSTPSAPPANVLSPNSPPRTPIVEEVPAAKDEPVVPPSAPFRQFVTSLRVNGVFQGENPRAMLNGRMYNVGAEVDPKLGITLHKIEPEAKFLYFRDANGAIVSRHY